MKLRLASANIRAANVTAISDMAAAATLGSTCTNRIRGVDAPSPVVAVTSSLVRRVSTAPRTTRAYSIHEIRPRTMTSPAMPRSSTRTPAP